MKLKKLTAIILSLALALSLATVASAASTGTTNGSITIDDNSNGAAVAGKTFNAYRLFDLTATDTGADGNYDLYASYSYSAPWVQSFFNGLLGSATDVPISDALHYVTYGATDINDTTQATAAEMQTFAKAAAAYIPANSVTYTGTATAGASGSVTISPLPIGYYIVMDATGATDSTSASACMINYTTPNVTIDLKATNVPNFDKESSNEWNDGGTYDDEVYAAIGDAVPFELSSTVPDVQYYKSYILKFSDTMTDGLTFNADSLKVQIGSASYVYHAGAFYAATDTTYITAITAIGYTAGTNGFDLTLTLKDDDATTALYNFGAAVSVTYTGTVNSNAVTADPQTNSATLTYTNNPNGETHTTPPDTIKVYTLQMDLTKVDGSGQAITTDTATFALYGPDSAKAQTPADNSISATKTVGANTYYFYGIFTTDASGKISIEGLGTGTYYLTETKAPNGYNLLPSDVEVMIDATGEGNAKYSRDGGSTWTDNDEQAIGHIALDIQNNTGVILPSTGGMGTVLFTVGGSGLILGAGLFLALNKKRVFGK